MSQVREKVEDHYWTYKDMYKQYMYTVHQMFVILLGGDSGIASSDDSDSLEPPEMETLTSDSDICADQALNAFTMGF